MKYVQEFKEMNPVMKGAVCYGLFIVLAVYQNVIESVAKFF
jgi:hypothetical protein